MPRTILRIAGSILLALLCGAAPASASVSVQKIGTDLYAYISENDASANSTFLIGDRGILVVDTGLNVQEGRKLLEEIRKISPLPVRWIVNTHYHPDHRGGNSIVGPDAVIISTVYTRTRILQALGQQATKNGQHPPTDYELNENIAGEISLYVGSHEVRIFHPGPAHTLGDLVVHFPDQHAIATGDLFLTNSCPAMDDGDLKNWVRALDQILALPVEHIVPGHFEVATKKELRHFRDYLAELRDQIDRMHSKGFTLAQVQGGLKLSQYDDLRQFPKYEATFADNAAAYYGQLQSKAR
jgi:cyclase